MRGFPSLFIILYILNNADNNRRKIMKLYGKYSKCHYQKIIQIKDTFHSNVAGNIAQAIHFFT